MMADAPEGPPSTFFCPYRGRDCPIEDGNEEHVMPKSLGGPDALTVRVERGGNSVLGSHVDAPMVELYAGARVEFDLRGHSGSDPVFELPVTVPALGGHRGTWRVSRDGARVELTPRVVKQEFPDGTINFSIGGDPATARRIAEDFIAKHVAKGRKVGPVTETPTRIDQPEIRGTFPTDLVANRRFRIKLTLGVATWLWGEAWARTRCADRLRAGLWCASESELDATAPHWAMVTPEEARLRLERYEHAFLTFRTPDGRHDLGAFVFGQAGTLMQVGELGDGVSYGDSVLIIVDVRDRSLRRLSLMEAVAVGRIVIAS